MSKMKKCFPSLLRALSFAGAWILLMLTVGCQSTGVPIRTYNETVSRDKVATVTLRSAGGWNQNVAVVGIDGKSAQVWERANAFEFLPGPHTIRLGYATAQPRAIGVAQSSPTPVAGAGSSATFTAEAGRHYELQYGASRMFGLRNLRLVVTDLIAGRVVADTESFGDSDLMAKPVAADKARIHFTRKFNLLGAAVEHFVVDLGSNLEYDAKLAEKKQTRPNNDLAWNVACFEMVNGGAVLGDGSGAWMNPNARCLGIVGNSKTIVFDRPAGVMKLRLITPGGDEAFAPDFNIEGGKTYDCTYRYGITGVSIALEVRR